MMFQDEGDYKVTTSAPARRFGSFRDGPQAGFLHEGDGLTRRPLLDSYEKIIINTSGGKDSQVMMEEVVNQAKAAGVFDRCIAVHCDLGVMEWVGTRELAHKQARYYGLPFVVREREQGDILQHTWDKYQTQLKKGQVAAPWPNQVLRWCTSDHKSHQVSSYITELKGAWRRGGPARFLNCLGLRAMESDGRDTCQICKGRDDAGDLKGRAKTLYAQGKLKNWTPMSECWVCAGTGQRAEFYPTELQTSQQWVDEWLPIHRLSHDEVWERIAAGDCPHAPSYDLGFDRLSCVFCFFAGFDTMVAAGHKNPILLQKMVDLEQRLVRPDADARRAAGKYPLYSYLQNYSLAEVLAKVKTTTFEEAQKKMLANLARRDKKCATF